MSLGQDQGHFCKIDYSDCWTPVYFDFTNLRYLYDYQGQCHLKVIGHLKVKVILRSFVNQIVSVWISILKRAVGFHPNAFLFGYEKQNENVQWEKLIA